LAQSALAGALVIVWVLRQRCREAHQFIALFAAFLGEFSPGIASFVVPPPTKPQASPEPHDQPSHPDSKEIHDKLLCLCPATCWRRGGVHRVLFAYRTHTVPLLLETLHTIIAQKLVNRPTSSIQWANLI